MTKRLILLFSILAVALFGQTYNYSFYGTAQAPVMQSVGQVGTQGTSFYCYWVVAVYTGGKSQAAGPICTSTSNGTLSSTNYNTITFLAPSSPLASVASYDILRTTSQTPPTGACACAVLTAQAFAVINDQSNTLSAYTVSPVSGLWTASVDVVTTASTSRFNLKDQVGATNQKFAVNGVDVLDAKAGVVINGVYQATGETTDANLATGVVIVPAKAGSTVKLLAAYLQPIGGTAATCTAINFTDSDLGATQKFSFLVAGTLAQNVVYGPTSASTLVTVGGGTALDAAFAAGKGIGLINTGSACATATSFKWEILYTVNATQ